MKYLGVYLATIKIKNTRKVKASIKRQVDGFLKDNESMDRVAKILTVEMKDELADPKNQTKQISSQWAARRAQLAKKNKTSKYYSGAKSNIHFTGSFVSSLKGLNKGRGVFEFTYSGLHKAYKLIKGGKTKRSSNKDIADGLRKNGFKVFLLPRKNAPRRILNIFRRYLRRNKKL